VEPKSFSALHPTVFAVISLVQARTAANLALKWIPTSDKTLVNYTTWSIRLQHCQRTRASVRTTALRWRYTRIGKVEEMVAAVVEFEVFIKGERATGISEDAE